MTILTALAPASVKPADDKLTSPVPALALPASFSAEKATLGRQPNNDGDNSCAMFFE